MPGNVDIFKTQKEKFVELLMQAVFAKRDPTTRMICGFMRGDIAARIAGIDS